ncbi:MAG: hypothetical protein V3V10_02415 [Planctomycetota bacterium]
MSEADKAKRRMMGEPEPPNPAYKYQNSRNAEKSKRKNKLTFESIANGIPKHSWLRNGQMPSLWTMARIQFGMGVLNVVMTFLTAASGIVVIKTYSSSGEYIGLNIGTLVWIGIAGLVFTTATAVFMLGAAITSYLARLNDRQTSEDISNDSHTESTPPSRPVEGIVPKGPLTDLADNEPTFKPGLQTPEEE